MDSAIDYETLLVETEGRAGLIRFNRPKALNAFNATLIGELVQALDRFDADPEIGCIVLTGSDKAFAAGADIKEMQSRSFPDSYLGDFIGDWDRLARLRKPCIAAVAGFALGGGCEMALMCDLIVAADNAQFGQPEIRIGVFPGAGGTQRLTRAVGKAKAMDLILTGRNMGAEEAERCGLVARVVPVADLLKETMKMAETIASMSPTAALLAKESVNRAFETTLAEGTRFERRLFQALFGTESQREGMAAFVEKRPPAFRR
jgi:enoyl-CoA hydratase